MSETKSNTKSKYQRLYHTLLESYNIKEQIVLQKEKYQQLDYTCSGSYSSRGQILMHEHNYQQICYTLFLILVGIGDKY